MLQKHLRIQTVDRQQSKCPNCDGFISYRADKRKFGCDSCGSFFSSEQVRQLFKKKNTALTSPQFEDGEEVNDEFCRGELFRCTDCGAEIMTEPGTKAENCFCCGGELESRGPLPVSYRPECIIPFDITRENAVRIFTEKLSKWKFSPSVLNSGETIDGIKGIYVPVWMADCNVNIRMHGTGKVVRSWICDVNLYTETREYAVERKAEAAYFSVPSDAVGKMDPELMKQAGNYDLTRLQRFDPTDIYRYPAEHCSLDKGAAFDSVRRKIIADAKETLEKSVSSYTDFSAKSEHIDILGTDWNYALLPLWYLTCDCRGKTYRFAVNGQTGKFAGCPPVSAMKLTALGLAVLVLTTLIYALAAFVTGLAGDPASPIYLLRGYGIGFIAGLIAALIICFAISRRYRTVPDTEPDDYKGDGETNFTSKLDRYVRQYTTKVKYEDE